MAGFNDYLENAILNQILGGVQYTAPSTLYIGLSTGTILDNASGCVEPSTVNTGYNRVAISNDSTSFATTSTGTKSNLKSVTFPQSLTDWGIVTDFAIFDENTNGNLLMSGKLLHSKTVEVSDILSFGIGQLIVTLD